MKVMSIVRLVAALAVLMLPVPAIAQVVQPGWVPPPQPAPIPPPKIEVLPVPKMDAPLAAPKPALQNRGSFGQRAARCLDEGAAMGLPQGDRQAYARACANQ
jgi:hypothetical protein